VVAPPYCRRLVRTERFASLKIAIRRRPTPAPCRQRTTAPTARLPTRQRQLSPMSRFVENGPVEKMAISGQPVLRKRKTTNSAAAFRFSTKTDQHKSNRRTQPHESRQFITPVSRVGRSPGGPKAVRQRIASAQSWPVISRPKRAARCQKPASEFVKQTWPGLGAIQAASPKRIPSGEPGETICPHLPPHLIGISRETAARFSRHVNRQFGPSPSAKRTRPERTIKHLAPARVSSAA